MINPIKWKIEVRDAARVLLTKIKEGEKKEIKFILNSFKEKDFATQLALLVQHLNTCIVAETNLRDQ